MTLCGAASATEKTETTIAIDGPIGYEAPNGDKCFELDEYKQIAIVLTRYEACEDQKADVFDMLNELESKSLLLRTAADDLSIALEDLELERRALLMSVEASADKARVEARRAKVWRVLAAGGGLVSVVLGAVVAGLVIRR